jgi:hypothetical protein
MAEKLKVYVITMREIFCQALEKANAIDPDGSSAERRGDILVREMAEKFGDKYKVVLEEDSRPGYYNDRITKVYNAIKAGDLLKSKYYDAYIMMPIIDYTGYKDKMADLDSFFRRADLSAVTREKLLSFAPLLEAGKLASAVKNKTAPAGNTPESSNQQPAMALNTINVDPKTQPLPTSINILYSQSPFRLLRYPAEGILKLTKDNLYEFIPAVGEAVNPGRIKGAEVIRDENRDDTWVKITYHYDGQPATLYIAEFAEPAENDEFYTLAHPSTLIAALIKASPTAGK